MKKRSLLSRRDAIRTNKRNAVSLKPNPSGSGSAIQPGHQIDLVEVVVVDLTDLLAPNGIVGQLLERSHRFLVKRPPELVVAWYPALSISEDVDRREIEVLAVVAPQVLQVPGIVVERDGARMGDTERIEQVVHRDAVGNVASLLPRDVRQLPRLDQAPLDNDLKSNVSGISGCMR